MDSRLLTTFIEVCRSENIASAASRLGITQPAVSKRINSLEKELNIALFQRIGLKLSLTSAGENFLPMAQEILTKIENSKNDLLDMESRVAGELHIACSHHIALYRLPQILQAFFKKYPEIHFRFTFTESETAYQMVQSGNIDLAFLTLPASLSSQVIAKSLWIDSMKIMVAKDHSIFNQLKNITFEDILEFPAVLPEKATFTMRRIETAFRHRSFTTLNGLNANNMETIRMLIETGAGWGLLPLSMYRDSLQIIDAPDIKLDRTLGMAYHSRKALTVPAVTFKNFIESKIDH